MRTVMITGASSGIGFALAQHYADADFHVIACGRNQASLDNIQQYSDNIETRCFDVTDKSAVETVNQSIDSIDILILNAGNCIYIEDPVNFNSEAFESIIQTNLISLAYLLEYFMPKLVKPFTGKAEKPQLAFISSSATIVPFPKAQAYGASKAGVDYLAKTMAIDLAKHNVDVTLVHPGFIKTPLTDKNDFSMPFLLTVDQAADKIIHGIAQRKSYVQFPKRLTVLLHALASLPSSWWQALATRKLSS